MLVPLLVVIVATTVAGVIDIRRFRVPNAVTLPLFLSGILYHTILSGWEGLLLSGLGAVFGLGVLLIPYMLGGMGSGDVKLLAGVGAWLGIPTTIYVFVIAAFAAGAHALVIGARHGGMRRAASAAVIVMLQIRNIGRHLVPTERIESVSESPERRKHLVPFAAMIAVGVIVVVICSQWLACAIEPPP
jgi:prepilin peptidase CpaA